MANLFRSLISRRPSDEVARFSTQDYLRWLSTAWNGLVQPMYPSTSTYSRGKPAERIENSFTGYVYGAYKVNPIVYGLMTRRSSVFSEARFMWREVLDGKPGELFWNDALRVLSKPWPNGTTGELLTRMIQDVDLAGNCYVVNEGDRLRRLRPDWVQIILSGNPLTEPDVDVVGYVYSPGGPDNGDGVPYLPDEVCHWSPIPDPDAQYRGMSWLTPVVREILGDQAATTHKLSFFRNGASLGPIIRLPKEMTPEQFKKFIQADREAHQGAENAYSTMYIGGGADVTLAAANMQQLDFKGVMGAGETRMCVASGVPAVIAGVSEGLAGSSLNSGNYSTAKRSFADGTLRTLWRSACAALSTILEVPEDAELWYDESHIAFLREDQQDQATIDQLAMSTIVSGITGGFEPDAVVTTVRPTWSKTLKHSGLMSVQLAPPGSDPGATIDGTDQPPPPDDGVPPEEARSQSDLDDELKGLTPDEARQHLLSLGMTPTEVDELLHDHAIERRFSPDEPRIPAGHDGGGRWGSAGGLLDKLKLAGRIHLADGETFHGSAKLALSEDAADIPMAWTHRADGSHLRLGVGVDAGDADRWTGADLGATVDLDERGQRELRQGLESLRQSGLQAQSRWNDLHDRMDELHAQQRDLVHRQFPHHTKAQAKELDRLDAGLPEWRRALEYGLEREAGSVEFYKHNPPGSGLPQHMRDANLARVAELRQQIADGESRRAALTATPVPLSPGDAAELSRVDTELSSVDAEIGRMADGITVGPGSVHAGWGDLRWQGETNDSGDVAYTLTVMPGHPPAVRFEPTLNLTGTDLRKLLALLEQGDSTTTRAVLDAIDHAIERRFNPDQARIGKGHSGGGEFGSKITPLLEHWLAAGGKGDPLGEAGVSRQTIVKAAQAHGVHVPPRMPLTVLKAALYAAVHERAVSNTGGTLHPEVTAHQARVRRIEAAKPLAELAHDIDATTPLAEPERSHVIGEHITGAEQAGALTSLQADKLRSTLDGEGGAGKVKAAVGRMNKANGVTLIGSAEKTATFDPALHRPLVHDTAADSIEPGTRVRVVQQGWALDGEPVEKARVAPVGRPARKAAPRTAQTDTGGRIGREEAGRLMHGDAGYEAMTAKKTPARKAAPAKAATLRRTPREGDIATWQPTGEAPVHGHVVRRPGGGLTVQWEGGRAERWRNGHTDSAVTFQAPEDSVAPPTAPAEPTVRAPRKAHFDAIFAQLQTVDTEEQAHAVLAPLSATELKAYREHFGIPAFRTTKVGMRQDIIKVQVQGRLHDRSIRGYQTNDDTDFAQELAARKTGAVTSGLLSHLSTADLEAKLRAMRLLTSPGDASVEKAPAAKETDFAARVSVVAQGQEALDAAPGSARRGGFEGVAPGDRARMEAALRTYSGPQHESLNAFLRTGRADSLDPTGQDTVRAIDDAMDLSRLRTPVATYRTVAGGDLFGDTSGDLTGREWRDPAPVSTTVDQAGAEAIVHARRPANPTILRLLVPAGVGAVEISGRQHGEGELLLQRDLPYRVVTDHGTGVDGIRRLDVEVSATPTVRAPRKAAGPTKLTAADAAKLTPAELQQAVADGRVTPRVATQAGNRMEQAARERRAQIDAKRQVAEVAAEVHQLVDNESSPAAITHRLQAAQSRNGVDTTRLQAVAYDPQALAAEADRMATEAGLTRVGPPARQPVPFDRQHHKPIAGGIQAGSTVEVVRPGYVWTDKDGKQVRVADTLVEETGGPDPAPRNVTAPAEGEATLSAVPLDLSNTADLDPAVRDALAAYGSHGAVNVNDYLRGSGVFTGPVGESYRPQTEEWIRGLDQAMSTSPTGRDIVVWRGLLRPEQVLGDVHSLPKDLTGTTFVDPAFVSTSVSRAASDRFVGADRIQLRVHVPKGTSAIKVSGAERESEILLDRGLTYRVVADRSERWPHGPGSVRILDVEVVPRAAPAAPSLTPAKGAVRPTAPSGHWRPDGVTAEDEARLKEAFRRHQPTAGMPGADDPGYVERLHTDSTREHVLGQFIDRHSRQLGLMSRAKVQEDLGRRAKEAFAERQVAVSMGEQSLTALLTDGRFKNQLEVGRSDGLYQPAERQFRERQWFGIPVDADPASRPIYGYLTTTGSDSPSSATAIYGPIRVVLKDDVRSRTTAMVGDSMEHSAQGAPRPVDNPDWAAFTPTSDDHAGEPIGKLDRAYDGAAFNRKSYMEAQVHGGVSTDDIAEVVLPSAPSPALRALLEQRGIHWRTRRKAS